MSVLELQGCLQWHGRDGLIMWRRVPKFVCEQWPGPTGVLINRNFKNKDATWYYVGTGLELLRKHLDRMLHHQLWKTDLNGNVIAPLPWGGFGQV